MTIRRILILAFVLQAPSLAANPDALARLRTWVAATPLGKSNGIPAGDSKRVRRSFDLIAATLEQAALRVESGDPPTAEFTLLDRLSRGLEPSQAARFLRRLESLRTASPAQLREAATGDLRPRSEIVALTEAPPILEGARLAHESLPIKAPRKGPLAAETDADTIVLLTPEIRARAAALNNDPARIFAFVHDNIELELYPGALQNSLAVLWSGRAGASDQATLLIALLRAAGVPARYVFGSVAITTEQLAEWIGAKNPDAARAILNQVIPNRLDGDKVIFDHVWVEAFLNDSWVTLDPSFKTRVFQPGFTIPILPFKRDAFLSSVKPYTSVEAYLDQIRQYLRENHPGRALSEVAYTGTIRPASPDALPPTPSYIAEVFRRAAALDPADTHRINISINSVDGTKNYTNKTLIVPEICLQSLSVTSTAPGGAASPTTGTGTFRPQLLADNTVIAEGDTALPPNTPLQVRFLYFHTGSSLLTTPVAPPLNIVRALAPGFIMGIPLHTVHGQQYLDYRIGRLLASNPVTADTGQTLREMLHILGIRYYQRRSVAMDAMTRPLQLKTILQRGQFAFTTATAGADRQVEHPFIVSPNQIGIDVQAPAGIIVDLNRGALTSDYRDWRRTLGLTGSGLEHQVIEEITLWPGASTTLMFQTAGEEKVPLLTLTRANIAATLAPLPYSAAQKAELTALFNNAQNTSITLPARLMAFGTTRLFVYLAENDLGVGLYVLEGSNGGVGGPKKPKPPGKKGPNGNPSGSGGKAVGDPVTVSNGNMFNEVTDLALPALGFPIVLTRTYNSQSVDIGPFGMGWTHSYNMSVQVGADSADVVNSSGGTDTLRLQGAEYVSTLRLGLRLRRDGSDFILRGRHGFEWRFDAAQGKLRQLSDPNGNKQTLTWDTAGGRLLSIADPSGRQVTFNYNAQNRITTIQDFTGRRLTYSYDTGQRLSEAVDFGGNRTTYSYYSGLAAAQNIRAITDPEGNVTTFVYYADDKVFKTIHPTGGEMIFFYLPLRQTTIVMDERGFSTAYDYDDEGRITRQMDPAGNSVTSRYDANGLVLESADESGAASTFEYDAAGNLTRAVNPLGAEARFAYEPVFNRISSAVDPRGNTIRIEYDARGNATKTIDAAGSSTNLVYDPAGNLTGVRDAAGQSSTITYDANGQLTESLDPLGNRRRIERDVIGRPARLTNPLGNTSSLEYDSLDRVTSAVSPLARKASFAYDRIGRATQFTDPLLNVTRYAFDGLDNLITATLPTGESASYAYAPPDCDCSATSEILTAIRNPRGALTTFTYDYGGRPLRIRNANGDETALTYDGRGLPIGAAYADGSSIAIKFDLTGRLTARAGSDGLSETFTYDTAGNLLTASNPDVTYTFTYDERNLVASVLDSRFDAPIRYAYDQLGRLARMTDPQGGATDYTYDARGLVETIKNPAGLTTSFSYDAAGRRREVSFANGTKAAYLWDTDGGLVSLIYTAGDTILSQFSYEYDGAGNRVAMTDSDGRHTYTYDASYRLTAATHPDQPAERYTYDEAGNRTSSHSDPSLAYDGENRLAQFSYDPRGNQTTRGSQRLAYDSLRRLVRAERDSEAVAYKYDPFGRRIEKSVNGTVTKYLYSGENILQEHEGGGRLAAQYTYGPGVDEPLIMQRDMAYFYQRDGLGSIRALTTSDGKSVEQYRYDSFGAIGQTNPSAPPSAVGNPFLFTGREWDGEIGLYFYRARHYDPSVGRFLQADAVWNPSTPETLNRYAYVANNPVNFVDPSGDTRRLAQGTTTTVNVSENFGQQPAMSPQNWKLTKVGVGAGVIIGSTIAMATIAVESAVFSVAFTGGSAHSALAVVPGAAAQGGATGGAFGTGLVMLGSIVTSEEAPMVGGRQWEAQTGGLQNVTPKPPQPPTR